MSYSFSKWESIGLTLLLFNVPGLIVGAAAVGALWWLL
jgi:hypothetical protein